MKRQSHTQFARNYARMKADLQATEGAKVEAFRVNRAQARPDNLSSTKQQRHRAQSTSHRQQGAP